VPLEKQPLPEFQKKLKDACTWLGISQGRAIEHMRLLENLIRNVALTSK